MNSAKATKNDNPTVTAIKVELQMQDLKSFNFVQLGQQFIRVNNLIDCLLEKVM